MNKTLGSMAAEAEVSKQKQSKEYNDMVRIGIVDDELPFRDMVEEIVSGVLREISVPAKIDKYTDGASFFDKVKNGAVYHILLADIKMKKMDGIELGRMIRQKSPDMYIIFITSYEKYAAESYRIEAFQYILKQDLKSRLPGVIRSLLLRLADQEQEFRIVSTGTEKVKIFYRDIIYLYKSKGAKYVNYVTKKGIVRERISLEKLLKELNSRLFIPVERGYVVNMERILKIKGDTLYLEMGYEVQVSRLRLKTVKQEISRSWGGRG